MPETSYKYLKRENPQSNEAEHSLLRHIKRLDKTISRKKAEFLRHPNIFNPLDRVFYPIGIRKMYIAFYRLVKEAIDNGIVEEIDPYAQKAGLGFYLRDAKSRRTNLYKGIN